MAEMYAWLWIIKGSHVPRYRFFQNEKVFIWVYPYIAGIRLREIESRKAAACVLEKMEEIREQVLRK